MYSGGEGGRGVNMDLQAYFKRLANKNAIKPKIGDPRKFCPDLGPPLGILAKI
jgi:hypothetical protein